MTKEELAAILNGRWYRHEMTVTEQDQAKAAGLIVLFGASDDLLEVRGAVCDEAGAYDGTVARLDREGFVPDWDSLDHDDEAEVARYFKRKVGGVLIEAKWDWKGYSWWIETTLPHAAFDIVEDLDVYCRGIVIDAAALTPKEAP